ncbi:hypothetical protein Huta_2120 [Halorhabdus utahensis DSM 12940]|uniref:Uncharacterized protein n=1 Tax=Halorhabdus utahensis (strain DSM 12940 / JCM 11049 / AX-2) TaxID=519442 RepID=C7NU42_HALUD|nr:hypothetical protein [Halorhabdus utahensis]ACV12287.1 hypothetical protein Huta_2120 [Halorhabdus utahensis DSM 12940]
MTDEPSMFMVEICDRRMQFFYIFAFSLFFLLLMIPYLFVLDPNSAVYVVSAMNAFGLGVFALLSGGAIWYCKRYY